MVLLGTVCEPHIIHLMQGPLRAPSLVQAVVGYPGVEVEAGPLAAAEGSVVGNSRFQWLHGDIDGADGDRKEAILVRQASLPSVNMATDPHCSQLI